MKKLISDYEDEKVDALIRKAVKEEAENINAPDRIKEEIDEKIGRNHIMSKNVNKKIGIYILAGIILLVIIIAISVIATGKKVPQSGEVSKQRWRSKSISTPPKSNIRFLFPFLFILSFLH